MSSHLIIHSLAARARKVAALFACLLAPSLLAAQNASIALPDEAALEKIDSFRAYDETGFSYDFRTIGEDGQSSLMRVSIRLKGDDAALVRYIEPAKQRGQAVLVRGNAFWLYEPGMKNALRISPRQILFGQASAGDISRIGFSSMYAIMERGESDGIRSFKLKAKPGANATYELIDLFTDAEFRPVKALCKGKSGTLMKTISYEKYERIEGKELLTEYTLVDEINKKSELMRLSNFDRAVPPVSDFSVQALRFLK